MHSIVEVEWNEKRMAEGKNDNNDNTEAIWDMKGKVSI
jgi:hypothetical protein